MDNEHLSYSKDFNLGIILMGIYYVFEFGSFQALYPFVKKMHLPFIMVAISTIYVVLRFFFRKNISFTNPTTQSFALLCSFWICYSYAETISPIDREYTIKQFFSFFVYYLIVLSSVTKPSQFILLIDIWLLSICYSSLHGILQGGLVWGSQWLKDQNQFSTLLTIAIPFALFFLFNFQGKFRKIFYTSCLILFLTGVIVSASRGGFVALLSCGLLCLIFSKKSKIVLLLLFGCATILVFQFAPQKFFREVETISMGTEERTARARVYYYELAFKMFRDHPFLGVGPVNYPQYFSDYDYKRVRKYGTKRVGHSTPLAILSETGLIGAMIFFLLQVRMYKNWRFFHKQISLLEGEPLEKRQIRFFLSVANACAIAQVVFLINSLFLTLTTFPFYWCLVPFSETWKNLFFEYVQKG